MIELCIVCVTAIIVALILAGGISRAAYWIATAMLYKANRKLIEIQHDKEEK